ncbi:hypothetical protein FK535_27665 [Mycolicibacterium sp. 018/SC-01/001]|uniref:hypothetical protein n=1 Tax=Mycolicibacterium sp. 018/SC-01/001 TaxID=2592069 RepID=UPI00117FD997|nr:hypothetical protein [Mycolicibacterium sp. 018/SC-01/001]TRW76538.1 hypothetical protein FK535_27665 [Mycolicibacterium sp. 018/SC-01/001]
MGAVLGLSLTSTEVTWALVDDAERTLVDHDSLELDSDCENTARPGIDIDVARVAARGGHGLARACGLEVDRLRLVWTPDAEACGRRLRSDLRSLGVTVDAVPLTCATRVLIDPRDFDMPPLVALAYGAALAEVDPAEAITVALPRQVPTVRPKRPVRVLAAAIGVAAAAAVAAVVLTSGSVPEIEPAASAASAPAGADAGWVSVTAPVDGAAEPLRKVVNEPVQAYQAAPIHIAAPAAVPAAAALAAPAPAVLPPPDALPGPVPVAAPITAPEPLVPEVAPLTGGTATEPSAEPHLPAAEQQHLPGAEPLVAPLPGPEAQAPQVLAPQPQTPAGADPEMTVPANVFTALP